MIIRRKYLNLIRPYYNSDDIKILTGVRRCGKSTLLNQIKDEISKDNSNIIFFDFENYDDSAFCSAPVEFYNEIKKRLDKSKKNYVFIDEVHYLDDYERIIPSIRSSLQCSVFITDSSSSLLKGNLATRFTGRSISFLIMPFSFSEFTEITGKTGKDALDFYLMHGGMPAQYSDRENKDFSYLNRLYKSIIERDVVEKNNLRNKWQFNKISSYILSHSGETFSSSSISRFIGNDGVSCSIPTINSYCSYIKEAFLVSECNRFSIKGKQVLQTFSKYYAIDTGFITIQDKTGNLNLGLLLETVVYNELIGRGYDVYIGKTYNGEVDFFVKKENDCRYYQVAYDLTKPETQDREFKAFDSIKDNYPKYVISTDTVNYSRNGIIHINILDFLTET